MFFIIIINIKLHDEFSGSLTPKALTYVQPPQRRQWTQVTTVKLSYWPPCHFNSSRWKNLACRKWESFHLHYPRRRMPVGSYSASNQDFESAGSKFEFEHSEPLSTSEVLSDYLLRLTSHSQRLLSCSGWLFTRRWKLIPFGQKSTDPRSFFSHSTIYQFDESILLFGRLRWHRWPWGHWDPQFQLW